jgi:D-methionine transport system ATP-binding protein
MIEINNVRKVYGADTESVLGLDNINLNVKKGDIYGVIGKSGAGKSTLIRCINLLEKPTSGSIKISGVEITHLQGKALRAERRKIGMIFQHFNLLSSKTVFENIALPLKLAKAKKAFIENKVTALLALTGLTDKRNVYPSNLSGGQKQRVAIARALANDPEVLLCDEATSALDPETTKNILDLLLDINQKLDLTVLIITHEMNVIKDICDHVAVLDNGKVVEQGDVLRVFTQPIQAITRSLIRTAMRTDLPQTITDILKVSREPDHHPLLRFTYIGNKAAKPFLFKLGGELKIEFNILQANLELIQNNTIGLMLVQAIANDDEIFKILSYGQDNGLNIEVLGYVHQHNG